MAKFAILRTAKLKTFGNIAASLSHTGRERETPNADPEQTLQNEQSHETTGEVMASLKARLPEKYRKDAVLAVEYFIGGSPEWFRSKNIEEQNAYFQDALKWLEKRHGAANVVGWGIHRDESTPHLVAYVVPLDEMGKLNAKNFLGGKKKLSEMQSDFASVVGEKHELQRGMKGSTATHQTVKEFYGQLDKPVKNIVISAEDLTPKIVKKGTLGFGKKVETEKEIAQRVTKAIQKNYQPIVITANQAVLDRRRADKMQEMLHQQAKLLEAAERKQMEWETKLQPVLKLAAVAPKDFNAFITSVANRLKEIDIHEEMVRRIKDLPRVFKTMAGAAYNFAKFALTEIAKHGGDASKADWEKVEKESLIDSVVVQKIELKESILALAKHSPSMADPSKIAQKMENYFKDIPWKSLLAQQEKSQKCDRDNEMTL